jgi:hypothetical protein
MTRAVFEPARVHEHVSGNPARGKAQGRNDPRRWQFARANGGAETDRKRESSPEAQIAKSEDSLAPAKRSHF